MEPRKTLVETQSHDWWRLQTVARPRLLPAVYNGNGKPWTPNGNTNDCDTERVKRSSQGFAKTKQRSGKPRSASPTKNHRSSRLAPQQREARTPTSLLWEKPQATARNSLAPKTTRIWREQNARGINPAERRENAGKTSNAKRGRKVLEENKCSSSRGGIRAPSSNWRKSKTEKTSAAQGSHRATRETTKLLFQQNPGTKHTSRTPDSAPNALEEAA
jgi:hypothetical protein